MIYAVNNAGPSVLMFDQTKNKQLDVHVRFWKGGRIHWCYLESQFSKTQDILHDFRVSIVMPNKSKSVNVNLAVFFLFLNLSQSFHNELFYLKIIL